MQEARRNEAERAFSWKAAPKEKQQETPRPYKNKEIGVTKRLFKEKLRFKDGQYLRNVDIDLVDGNTSRKIRRIVEKRVCQAYYQKHKKNEGNGGRHAMKRSSSFHLHSIGQIEGKLPPRSSYTHWKRFFDPITGTRVLKPKIGYPSLEVANDAATEYMLKYESGKRYVTAYLCPHCGKWHIGHVNLISHKELAS